MMTGTDPTTPSSSSSTAPPKTPELSTVVRGLFNRPFRSSNLQQVVVPTPDSSPVSPSVAIPNSATRRNTYGRSTNLRPLSSPYYGPPSPYYGPSSSVSSLGFDTGLSYDDDIDANNSGSSTDEEELMGYDSDDRASQSSRRPSLVSVGGISNNIHGVGAMSTINGTTISNRSSLDEGTLTERGSGNMNLLSGLGITSRDAHKEKRRTIIRQTLNSGKSLKPKIKSLLRISKDLQEEMSPLDYEMRKEAEVTNNFRQEDAVDTLFQSFPYQKGGSSFINCGTLMSTGTPREEQPSDTDDSDFTNAGVSPPSPPQPQQQQQQHLLKRKQTEDNSDSLSGAIKRRAVSPALNTSTMGSPSGVNRQANLRRVQDASHGFENMKLG